MAIHEAPVTNRLLAAKNPVAFRDWEKKGGFRAAQTIQCRKSEMIARVPVNTSNLQKAPLAVHPAGSKG